MILRSPIPNVIIPEDCSLTEFVFRSTADKGDTTALIDGKTGSEYTHSELKTAILRAASGLRTIGVQPGDVCCIFSPNSIEFVISFLAVTYIGAVVTTVNPSYTPGELAYQLSDAKPRYLFTLSHLLPVVNTAKEKYGGLKKTILFDYILNREFTDCLNFSDVLRNPGTLAHPATVAPVTDVAALLYSSGTTGISKGCMLTHHSIYSNVIQSCAFQNEKNESPSLECWLTVLPLFHIYGIYATLCQMYRGARLVILPKFEPQSYLMAIERFKVTSLFLVPPLIVFLAKSPLILHYDLSSLKEGYSGAAPLGGELQSETIARLKLDRLENGYGMTECSSAVFQSPIHNSKVGSPGVLVPNTLAKIVNVDNGEELGHGKTGELCVKGPQVMKGYYNNPAATQAAIDKDGWLHTGDAAYSDCDQYFFVVDRLKELIKYKGFQVAPAELESVLLTHPDVADAAVSSIPDEEAGELPQAFVVLKHGRTTTPKELIEFMAGQLAPHKQLRGGIVFLKEIPKSPAGKILRRVLKSEQLQRVNVSSKL